MRHPLRPLPFVLAFLPALAFGATVQIDVSAVLTGRAVTTFTNGKLVPWTSGVDGAGKADGLLTHEAAKANGDLPDKAVPGDGFFAATPEHPAIQLHFHDRDATSPQIRPLTAPLEFATPHRAFTAVFVMLTSSEGASDVAYSLFYDDGTSGTGVSRVPDWYFDATPADKNIVSVATDLAKWNNHGTLAEKDHHFIHGLRLPANPGKQLTRIRLENTSKTYTLFWGATGETP